MVSVLQKKKTFIVVLLPSIGLEMYCNYIFFPPYVSGVLFVPVQVFFKHHKNHVVPGNVSTGT